MKLYTFDPAPNPRRLALFMQYKGIEIETRQIDLMAGEQFSDDFRNINPECTVPALVLDNGAILTQVIGICTYLEELHPQKPLMGTTALEKAQVISWDHKLFLGLIMAVACMLREAGDAFAERALPGPGKIVQIPELVGRGLEQLRQGLPELDTHLASSTWMTGDNFTLADIDLLASIDFMAWVKQSVPDECTHLKAWYERASAEVA